MMIGEAPGHNGCGTTGIPFTSEFIINSVIKSVDCRLDLLSKGNQTESTATIFWENIEKHKYIPLMWNSFPFHPHKKEDLKSNRPPLVSEMHEEGSYFIRTLIEIFQPKTIISVGRCAQKLMNSIEIQTEYIRHPSHGGKIEFSFGVKRIITSKEN